MLFVFFFNATATTEIYTLSLHDALPICRGLRRIAGEQDRLAIGLVIIPSFRQHQEGRDKDRKSTRLNSSHSQISYAVFCLKKKNNTKQNLKVITSSPYTASMVWLR